MQDETYFRTHKTKISEDVSQWHTISADFEGLQYIGDPILDTNVKLDVPTFCITWKDKEALMRDLAEVIRKYQI